MIKVSPFIKKLRVILNEPKSKNLIAWNDRTFTLTILKPEDFSIKILPFYFKHCNFSSFVRQLNLYGFHKIDPDLWIFKNESLTIDLFSEFAELTRKKKYICKKPYLIDINFLENQISETRILAQRMFIVLSKILELSCDNYSSTSKLITLIKILSKEIFILNTVIKTTLLEKSLL
jgi:hypothetical protein